MRLAEVSFYDLRYDRKNKSPVLFLKDSQREKYLPVWIGELEANSIEDAVTNKSQQRPHTHDLTINLLRNLGARLVKVIIDRLERRTYFATLVLETGSGEVVELDGRPSDAVALALRDNARIFVDDDLLYGIKFVEISDDDEDEDGEAAGMLEPEEEEVVDYETIYRGFQDFLNNISPGDFKEREGLG